MTINIVKGFSKFRCIRWLNKISKAVNYYRPHIWNIPQFCFKKKSTPLLVNEGKRNSGPVDHFNSEDHSGDQGKCWDWQISVIPQLPIYWSFLLTIRTCPIYKNGYCARTGQWETSRPQRSCLNGPFLPVSTMLRVKWMNALRFPAGKFKYFGLNATHRSRSVLHAHLLSFFFFNAV